LGRSVPKGDTTGGLTPRQQERRALRRALTGRGLSEAMPMPFLAPGELSRCGLPDDGIRIANPLVAEQSVLRTALLPGLVGAVAYNWSHRNHGVALFEIGHVFRRAADPAAELPDEREALGAVLAGEEAPAAVELVRAVAEGLGHAALTLENADLPGLHPTRGARVRLGGVEVGVAGEIDPGVLDAHGIGERVAYVELDLDTVLALPHGEQTYRPFSTYPSSDVDLAFEVADDVPATTVEDAIRAAGGDLLWSVQLFDVYRGDGVAQGTRSLAYRLRLQAQDRTLTDADVARVRQQVIEHVQETVGATLRG
jgi:phenylalanyl-tRNA synthetase beta chain